jgi:tetratricopeptide (TPR) repeat protein/transcriptional regulator with XRE-family HTH domain
MNEFGRLLRRYRHAVGLTQEELADRARISSRAVWDLECGRTHRPRRSTVNALVAALELSESDATQLARAARLAPGTDGAAGCVGEEDNERNSRDAGDPGRSRAHGDDWLTNVPPAQLPHDVAGFVGRRSELAQMNAAVASRLTSSRSGPMAIIVIDGPPGIGKTALAVHWAHQTAHTFQDGQLYIDLHGFSSRRPCLSPADALRHLLRGLGVAAERVPADLGEASAMFRSLVAGKRALLVLDNAADPAQVRPLLPGSPSILVVATSRNRLSGLIARDGAHRITLGVLSHEESAAALAHVIGPERIAAEPAAAADVATLCGHWPLPLRVAAERAAARPRIMLADLVRELTVEQDQLDALATDDDVITAVRPALSWSYEALPDDAALMFRLAGLHRGPDLSIPAAAVLADTTRTEALRLLTMLASVHLLEEAACGRYRFHDLLHAYAVERAGTEDSAQRRDAAVHRIALWYLQAADAADRLLIPGRRRPPLQRADHGHQPLTFHSRGQALTWCEQERGNLVAMVQMAAEHQQHEVAWQLPAALWGFFDLRKHCADWMTTHRIGIASARRAGSKMGEAWLLNHLGTNYWRKGQFDDAITSYRQALTLWRDLGDRRNEAGTMNNLGVVASDLGRFHDSISYLSQCLAVHHALGDRRGEALALNNLAETYREMGRPDFAVVPLERAVAIQRELMDRSHIGEGMTLHSLGAAYLAIGDYGLAITHLQASLGCLRGAGDRYGEGVTLHSLGAAYRLAGRHEDAITHLACAVQVKRELGDHSGETAVRAQLTTVRQELGDAEHR